MNEGELLERIGRLEANLTHLERQNDALNGVVVEQGRELQRLRKLVDRLNETFESQELDRIRSNTAPPPHYGR